jgi:hypothetical protein
MTVTLLVNDSMLRVGKHLGPKDRRNLLDWLEGRYRMMGANLTGIRVSVDGCAWDWFPC